MAWHWHFACSALLFYTCRSRSAYPCVRKYALAGRVFVWEEYGVEAGRVSSGFAVSSGVVVISSCRLSLVGVACIETALLKKMRRASPASTQHFAPTPPASAAAASGRAESVTGAGLGLFSELRCKGSWLSALWAGVRKWKGEPSVSPFHLHVCVGAASARVQAAALLLRLAC